MAVNEVVECVGPEGMIGGQIVDLTECENGAISPEERRRKDLKTSSLTVLSLKLGAILSGADDKSLEQLTRFASKLGQAYQKRDDLNDIAEDHSRLRSSKTVAALGSRSKVPVAGAVQDEPHRREFLTIGVRKDIDAAKHALQSHFPPVPARDCLLQLASYIETSIISGERS